MLYLESFTHRVRFAEIVSRWMVNQPEPNDVMELKTIVNFNSYVARLWADNLARTLLERLWGKQQYNLVAKTKGKLKDFVVDHPVYTNASIEQMIAHYRRFPEDFYRETPFDGHIYYTLEGGQPIFTGSTRIKRFRRIAEKGSRRIVDFMFERIRGHADELAAERAKQLGILKDQLITPPEVMEEEFRHAERRLIKSIKLGTIQSELPILSIPDVVGVKLIVEKDQHLRLLDRLAEDPACTLLEQERHSGRYNATNLRLAYVLPRGMLAAQAPSDVALDVLATRGLAPDRVPALYRKFLDDAEDHVLLEIIVANFEDFLDSEIGSSMHEDRVLFQRADREYKSHLATSIRYLMDYMLTLCLAPQAQDVTDVPIKLWVKYMPDTIDRLIRDVYNVPADASFDGHATPTLDRAMENVLHRPAPGPSGAPPPPEQAATPPAAGGEGEGEAAEPKPLVVTGTHPRGSGG